MGNGLEYFITMLGLGAMTVGFSVLAFFVR